MTRWRHGRLLLFLIAFIPLVGAEPPVVYLRFSDAITLDPGKAEEFYSQEVIFNVFENLVRLRPEGMEAEPCLAERWQMRENGRRWVFTLRRGVKFHNGKAFNARAVVYSFQRRIARRTGEYASFGRIFPYIEDVRALDDWTVEFLLSRPHSQFLLALVDQRACIVAPGAMDNPLFKPVGTGPFVLSEWVRGRSIVLDRFAGYWQPPVGLARIIFRYEPNTALRLTQIKNHSADINFIRSAKEYEELIGRKDVAIISEPKLSTQYLGFNCRRPPFSSLPVRKAFFHLLNKEILVKRIFQNFAVPAAGMLPPRMPGYDAGIGRDDFNPGKARQLLAQAGWRSGFSVSLYLPEGQFGLEDLAWMIIANARLVGVTVKAVTLPLGAMIQAVRDGEPDLFTLGWGYTADPGIFMNPLFLFSSGGSRSIMTASPEFTRLLVQAEETEDPQRRNGIYSAAQRRLQEDMPLIPLFYLNHVLACSRRLRNLRLNPFGFILFKEVSVAAE
ncbi:MAG: ABC transporter substrate-binding protein [Acidobacteria bacterium]|jgi:peptide/nickel transport system substrate-binding protein|nr:ABC transporter substrate-binding protein [Acidobacteriota bacterium]